MIRRLPSPLLVPGLLLLWLLLQQSLSPGQIALGILVALLAAGAMRALRLERARIRFSSAIPRLAGIVVADIVRSNIAVARIILSRRARNRTAGFLYLPLDMQSRQGLALLGIIITATPGTLWMQHDSARGVLLVHVLDLVDEDAWIRLIKHRYERLLMEIFE